jgi:hypothetical protein
MWQQRHHRVLVTLTLLAGSAAGCGPGQQAHPGGAGTANEPLPGQGRPAAELTGGATKTFDLSAYQLPATIEAPTKSLVIDTTLKAVGRPSVRIEAGTRYFVVVRGEAADLSLVKQRSRQDTHYRFETVSHETPAELVILSVDRMGEKLQRCVRNVKAGEQWCSAEAFTFIEQGVGESARKCVMSLAAKR